jgi:hypothetical protein
MIDDDEESATIARWVLPAARGRARYPHPNTVVRSEPDRSAGPPRRHYGDGAFALGTAQAHRVEPRPRAAPPPIPAARPPRALARASTAPVVAPAELVVATAPAVTSGDRAAWRWLAALTAIAAILIVGAVAYAIVGLGLVAR